MVLVDRPRALALRAGCCVLVLLGVAGAALATDVLAYWAGLRNANRESILVFAPLLGALMWLGSMLVGAVLMAILWVNDRTRARWPLLALSACFLAGVGWVAVNIAIPSDHRYATGFQRWAEANVDERAILAWTQTLPPATRTTTDSVPQYELPVAGDTPLAECPPAIVALAPVRVTRLTSGVLLQWGRFGTWGDSRRAFVAIDEAVDPNRIEDNFPPHYVRIRPRVWVAFQGHD